MTIFDVYGFFGILKLIAFFLSLVWSPSDF